MSFVGPPLRKSFRTVSAIPIHDRFVIFFVHSPSVHYFIFSFLSVVRDAGFQSKAEMANHVLLFVSALIPKALAALMTSFCIELGKPQNVSKSKALTHPP